VSTQDKLKIIVPWLRCRYYKDLWLELLDGGSDQWLYVCGYSLTYIFIDIKDDPAWAGSDATNLFSARVQVVDLFTTPLDVVASAMQSCGRSLNDLDFKKAEDRLSIAEMLQSVGSASPMWNDAAGKVGPNSKWDGHDERHPAFRTLRRKAHDYARVNLFDEEIRNHLLDTQIVNGIGQTAREYAQGIEAHWNALRRLKELGDKATPEQQLMLKMTGRCENTLGAGPIPKDLREAK
jgi:hypothetical protein